jgi:hypothetical protein
MKKPYISLILLFGVIPTVFAQTSVIVEDFENVPVENFWQDDVADRTGTFFAYNTNRAPLMIVENPAPTGINTSPKVCRVQVFAGGANSGIVKIEFVKEGTTKPEPVIDYPACPTCENQRYDRLRFKYYKGNLQNRNVELEPNGSPTSPKTITPAVGNDEWEYIVFELSAATYNTFQLRVNRNADGSGSAQGTADGDFIYLDDFEFYSSAEVSSVGTLDASTFRLVGIQGAVSVAVAQPAKVEVFNLTGQCVASTTVQTESTINLPAGIYLVAVNGQAQKIAVK